jgi:hypothetical protein
MICLIIILLLFVNVYDSFKINFFDPVIGKWNLLYCDNPLLNLDKNKCELSVDPFENKIDKLSVKITKFENYGLLRFSKTINSNAYYSAPEVFNESELDNISFSDGDYCSLVMLTAQKSISSIGIFDFPYLASDYKSEMRPKYLIRWRIDNALNRLYIYLDGKTYIFERGYCGKKAGSDGDTITTNAFFITNIISFLLGKLLEKAIHL